MAVYYNEFDPFAAEWLRRLITAGHLPAGDVDQRDIRNISPNDLKPYTQCHFFAGIGGWPLALQAAGWPNDNPVWTGSCPCQPFSTSGKRQGFDDERHLWPVWFDLIKACQPATVFGEQVASPAALDWFDVVSADLETSGYAVGAADLCAAGLGAPHIRQRLWFGATHGLEVTPGQRIESGMSQPCTTTEHASSGAPNWSAGSNSTGRMVHANLARPQRRQALQCGKQKRIGATGLDDRNPWADPEWIWCQDNKWRPTEPGLCPLADGLPGRVGRLRAYGNAIVPQVAATFVEAFEDALTDSQIVNSDP